MSQNPDKFDLSLLGLLQKNARLTTETLAEKVGLSPPAVHRRLRKLRDSGLIEKEVAVLNSRELGRAMTFVVSIEVERERIDLLDALKKEFLKLPNVQQCYYVTGETDFILIVKARDMQDYQDFTQKAFFGNTNIRKFKTSVVMSEVKTSLEIPLGD